MRGVARVPAHRGWDRPPRSPPGGPTVEGVPEDRFINRPCYVFNPDLGRDFDDARCRHCRHYLTARCPHIDEFLDDVEDLEPD